MAITFLEKRKIQRRYIIIFGIVLLVTILVIWRGFFVEKKPVFLGEVTKTKKVELDFKILENPILKELQPFEEIEPFREVIVEEEIIEKIGRENPFVPY
jgi:hypothetical protein